MTPAVIDTGAVFSHDRRYRTKLWRVWDAAGPRVMFVGLNPSTADEVKDDPTVARCHRYARRWGYGSFWMANLFAFRATDPQEMKAVRDPVGRGNDAALVEMARASALIVACWGNHGLHLGRSRAVRALLPALHCLALNAGGEPAHPLYLRSDLAPKPLPAG